MSALVRAFTVSEMTFIFLPGCYFWSSTPDELSPCMVPLAFCIFKYNTYPLRDFVWRWLLDGAPLLHYFFLHVGLTNFLFVNHCHLQEFLSGLDDWLQYDGYGPPSLACSRLSVSGNLVSSTGLIVWIGHRKEIRKLTFRALALRRSESRNCGLCVAYIQKDGATLLVGAW